MTTFIKSGVTMRLVKLLWTMQDKVKEKVRFKIKVIVKLVEIVEIVEIKVDCHFYFYYAFVGLYSVNIFC